MKTTVEIDRVHQSEVWSLNDTEESEIEEIDSDTDDTTVSFTQNIELKKAQYQQQKQQKQQQQQPQKSSQEKPVSSPPRIDEDLWEDDGYIQNDDGDEDDTLLTSAVEPKRLRPTSKQHRPQSARRPTSAPPACSDRNRRDEAFLPVRSLSPRDQPTWKTAQQAQQRPKSALAASSRRAAQRQEHQKQLQQQKLKFDSKQFVRKTNANNSNNNNLSSNNNQWRQQQHHQESSNSSNSTSDASNKRSVWTPRGKKGGNNTAVSSINLNSFNVPSGTNAAASSLTSPTSKSRPHTASSASGRRPSFADEVINIGPGSSSSDLFIDDDILDARTESVSDESNRMGSNSSNNLNSNNNNNSSSNTGGSSNRSHSSSVQTRNSNSVSKSQRASRPQSAQDPPTLRSKEELILQAHVEVIKQQIGCDDACRVSLSQCVGTGLIRGETRLAFDIEFCTGCASHCMTTRHDASKYLGIAESMRDLITKQIPGCFVRLNKTRNPPRIGAFEITCSWQQGGARFELPIYSKIQTKKFPNPETFLSQLEAALPQRRNVSCEVSDVVSGNTLSRASVCVRRADESRAVVSTARSNENGPFALLLSDGVYVADVACDGYLDASCVFKVDQNTHSVCLPLSPPVDASTLRVVLVWGEKRSRLEMKIAFAGGGVPRTETKLECGNMVLFRKEGPQTAHLKRPVREGFHVYVFQVEVDDDDSIPLNQSHAKVMLIGSRGVLAEYQISSAVVQNSAKSEFWDVFSCEDDGDRVACTSVNQISSRR